METKLILLNIFMESEAKKEYELKKEERLQKREETSKNAKNSNSSKKLLTWFIVLIILISLGWGIKIIIDKYTPSGEDFSQSFPISGREHIDVGSVETLPEGIYNSNPPSSGPHYPDTIETGFYEKPIEDQFAIHNLEHGDIWIVYSTKVSEEVKRQLKGFTGRYVLISPRENNPTDISLVSWGRVDSFNLENGELVQKQRIRDFILRYDNKGPEQVRGGGAMGRN